MTLHHQSEIVLLRNDARVYDELAATYHDTAIAALLREQAQHFREQADKLEKGPQE